MGNYSMPRYFQNMPVVGKPVRANAENVAELKAIEEDIHNHIVDALEAGKPDADMNAKGQLTAMQRVSLLVDPGTWCPLNSLYNPEHNKNGSTSIVKGLGRVNGWIIFLLVVLFLIVASVVAFYLWTRLKNKKSKKGSRKLTRAGVHRSGIAKESRV